MTLRRFENIVAIRNHQGEYFGFHATNLEAARLEPGTWPALAEWIREPHISSEVTDELREWNAFVSPDAHDEPLATTVRYLSLNVTQICNLRCTYCAAGGDGTYGSDQAFIEVDKVLPQIRLFMEKLLPSEIFTIRFLGGEPLLYPEALRTIGQFARQVARDRDLQVQFSITTNGTLLTAANVELLAELNCRVTISIDGPESLNDLSRVSKDRQSTTAKVLAGLHQLSKVRTRLKHLGANCVLGPHNLRVRESYYFLNQFGFDSIGLNFAASNRDAEINQTFIEELSLLADELYETGGETELRKIPDFDHIFRTLDQQCRTLNHCGAGKSLLQIDSRGDIYACNWFMNQPQNRVGTGLELDRERLDPYQKSLIEQNNCQTCWARYMCGGGCLFVNQLKSGDRHRKDEAFCQRQRSLTAKGIELFVKARETEQGEE